MSRLNSRCYCTSFKDNDSGIGLDYDYDYSSSRGYNAPRLTFNEPYKRTRSQTVIFPIPGVTVERRTHPVPLIQFPWDGKIERIRPATMRNSQNGDYIFCDTGRGSYVACRTPIVPDWVRKLVAQIEAEQR